jgi:opacity protein-like surface antigen
MYRYLLAAALVCGVSAPASAQDVPKVEIGAGFTLLHEKEPHANLKGWVASIGGNLNSWLGIAAEVGQNHGTPDDDDDAHHDVLAFMAGPRFSARMARATPFAQLMVGVHHSHVDISGAEEEMSGFAWQAGGGLDLRVTPRVGIRFGGDFRHVEEGEAHADHHHTDFRFQAGLVFRFGSR